MIVDPKDLIEEFVGVPYLKDGRTSEGVDCYGVMVLAYRKRGLEIPDVKTDATTLLMHRHFGIPIRYPCEIGPWDAVLMSWSEDRNVDLGLVTHVALAVDRTNILHAVSKAGGVVLDRLTYYEPYIVAIGRMRLPKINA